MINTAVFKAYDVRGLYPSEITEDLFHQLGRAFVAYLGPGKYAVTRDMRVSSPSLTQAFIDGAVKQGGHIIDYGLMGTDQMYYAVAADHLDGGAQITASHNPGEYNGCKMVRKEAFPLSGEAGIKEMKEMIVAGAIPARDTRLGREARDHGSLRRARPVVCGRAVDQAVQRRPRRRERRGRHCRATVVRSPALQDDAPVLRGGRHVPEPRGEPADRREPPGHHR
jgi:phosphomannomutase